MAALQIKKYEVFLALQAIQYILNISYQKKERKHVIKNTPNL